MSSLSEKWPFSDFRAVYAFASVANEARHCRPLPGFALRELGSAADFAKWLMRARCIDVAITCVAIHLLGGISSNGRRISSNPCLATDGAGTPRQCVQ